MPRIVAVLAIALACTACEADERDPDDVTHDQAASLAIQLAQQELEARQYEQNMSRASEATCIGTHRTYDQTSRVLVTRMRLLEADLDVAITDHGGTGYADVACLIDAIAAELDAHLAVACQDATIELDRAEAIRHVTVLAELRAQLRARLDEIEAGIDAGGDTWTWTAPSACP